MKYFYIFLIFLGVVILLSIIITISVCLYHKHRNKIKDEAIYNLLSEIIDIDDYKLERISIAGFNYRITSKSKSIYICVVDNFNCNEILVNSPLKWQTKSNPTDDSIKFIESIKTPMLAKIKDDKEIHKLFIVYPNARQLMRAVNECEYEFIYPETDVFGVNAITYNTLLYTKEVKNL